jgi:uncharacterized protein (TIRG00374 family)
MNLKRLMQYFSLLGIILFVFVLTRIDFASFLSLLSDVRIRFIVLALLLLVIEVMLRSFKWRLLVQIFDRNYPLKNAVSTYLIGYAFGAITPAKSGDVIKSVDLSRTTGMDMRISVSLAIFDKIVDASILFGLTLVSSIVVIFLFSDVNRYIIPLIAALIVFFIIFFFLLIKDIRFLLRPVYELFVPDRLKSKAKEVYLAFVGVINHAKGNILFYYYILIAVLDWTLLFSLSWVFSLAIGLDVPWFYFVIFVPIISTITLLPITVLGLGSRETASLFLFSLIGLSTEASVAVAWLGLFFIEIPQVIAGFLITIFFDRKKPS